MRILPHDMEQGLKEFASGVEQLVDRLVRLAHPARRQIKPCRVLSTDQRQSMNHTKYLPHQMSLNSALPSFLCQIC